MELWPSLWNGVLQQVVNIFHLVGVLVLHKSLKILWCICLEGEQGLCLEPAVKWWGFGSHCRFSFIICLILNLCNLVFKKYIYLYIFGCESEVAQSCLTLCDPTDCSLPGSSVDGVFQARILEWVAISFSRGSSPPRDWTRVSRIVGRRFTVCATREVYLAVPGLCCFSCFLLIAESGAAL